jgi:hypothetical protein
VQHLAIQPPVQDSAVTIRQLRAVNNSATLFSTSLICISNSDIDPVLTCFVD